MKEFLPDVADPQHWDFVISCFEPVTRVTGGIGTYTRLLLELAQEMRLEGRRPEVLFLTGERQRSQELTDFCPDATVVFIPEHAHHGKAPINNLGDPYRHFGQGILRTLRLMGRLGHTFGLYEMPDYSAEGYYVMKAIRHGLLDIEQTAVRLHSPLFMLHEDNDALPWCDSSAYRFHDMERYVLEHVDHVFYGGDAMLDRVCALVSPELAERARKKAVKLHHPWPEGESKKGLKVSLRRTPKFAYIGRLEFRKGVDLLVEAALQALEGASFELHFFGRDTDTWRSTSMRAQLDRLIGPTRFQDRFVFHDYVPQPELWATHLPKMDGFVFPSRFENYPNVLLEVMGLHKPTLVSKFGCMPEMGAALGVTSVDPFDKHGFAEAIVRVCRSKPTGLKRVYPQVRDQMNESIQRGYEQVLSSRVTRTPVQAAPLSLTFVAAHYNQSKWLPEFIRSVKKEMKPGDACIVVDDCSSPAEAKAARSLVETAGFTFLTTPQNGGPSVARNLAVRNARTDAVYIVDTDDLLEPDSTQVLRESLARHPELAGVSGYFQAFGDEHHCWAAYDPIMETILLENSTHCGLLLRRSVYEALGGYHEGQREHFEDWEFAMRLALSEQRVEVLPLVSYRYRVRKTTSRNNTRLYRAGYSYEHAVRRALAAMQGPTFNWQRFARFVPTLLARYQFGSSAPPVPSGAPVPTGRVVRYELADRLNLMLKPTPLHRPLKNLADWTLNRGNRDEADA